MIRESPKVSGGCLCGAVRYGASEPPFSVGYCHCRRCQKGIGNIFGTAALFWRQALFVTGEMTWFQSSPTLQRGFCPVCGSPIAAQHKDRDYTAVWVGTLDHPEDHPATVQWYCDAKIPWGPVGGELPDASATLPGRSLTKE